MGPRRDLDHQPLGALRALPALAVDQHFRTGRLHSNHQRPETLALDDGCFDAAIAAVKDIAAVRAT